MNNENEEKFLEYILNSDAQNMLMLGKKYYLPKNDFSSALRCFKKALECGNNEAFIWIARLYEKLSIQEESKDHNEYLDITIEWYEKALNYYENNYKNNAEYAFEAGNLLSGEDAFKVDFEKAFEYYYYGANTDSTDEMEKYWIRLCQMRLSKMYELGLGCEKDLKLSKHYRKIAKISKKTYNEIKFINN